jgi:glycerol-3-phosphate dehydrogenase (NAD(P)+)
VTDTQNKITVLGTTSWGITLASLIAKKNIAVNLWARTEKEAYEIELAREDTTHLPGIILPRLITVKYSLESCVENSKYILIAVPSHSFRENILNLSRVF